MTRSGLLSGLLLGTSLSLFTASATADLRLAVEGLPHGEEAEVSIEANGGIKATLGITTEAEIGIRKLPRGWVTVRAEPVEYNGITYTAEESVVKLWATANGRIRKAGQRLRENRHPIIFTTSEPPSQPRLFAGLDRGILWNCDVRIPNSCGIFDNAGKGKDLTHVAYGGGYVWTSLLDGGGVDDSKLWRCSATALNACATWDPWPKSQVTVTGIAYGDERVFISWHESGSYSGSSGIKSCDANASSADCFDLYYQDHEDMDVWSVAYADGVVYAIVETMMTSPGIEGTISPLLWAFRSNATSTSTENQAVVYADGSDDPWLPSLNYSTLATDQDGFLYAGFDQWGRVAKMRQSSAGFGSLDYEVLQAQPGCSATNCKPIQHLTAMNETVYAADNTNTIRACLFTSGRWWNDCRPTEWRVAGQGTITSLTSSDGRVYISYSSGRMYECDANTPDSACSVFNTAGDSINDMVFVADPGQ